MEVRANHPAATLAAPTCLELVPPPGPPEPCTPAEIRAVRAAIAPPLRVSYGSSESGVMAHLRGDEPAEAGLSPVPGMNVQAVDANGVPLSAGAVGRLRFRAPWLPSEPAPPGTACRWARA